MKSQEELDKISELNQADTKLYNYINKYLDVRLEYVKQNKCRHANEKRLA